LEEVEDVLLDRVLARMMSELNEEDAQKITVLLEEEKQEEVSSIFCEKFPNMNDFFIEEIEIIQKEILDKYSK